MEEDQLQDHEHQINVTDPGHAHPYIDQTFFNGVNGYYGPDGKDTKHERFDYPYSKTTSPTKTSISAVVNGVKTGRHGAETRPKNMNVIYIIRVF